MARITTVRRARKKTRCGQGGHPIKVGESYQWMKRRFGRGSARFTGCPSHPLKWYTGSASKMVGVWEGVDAATDRDGIESLAETARDTGAEYRDGVSNMPENFQQGEQGQAMETMADALETWADELEAELPEPHEWVCKDGHMGCSEEEEGDCNLTESLAALENVPEYEG